MNAFIRRRKPARGRGQPAPKPAASPTLDRAGF